MQGWGTNNIIIPGRYGIQPPRWPFVLNRASIQTDGLLALWTPWANPNIKRATDIGPNQLHLPEKTAASEPILKGDISHRVGWFTDFVGNKRGGFGGSGSEGPREEILDLTPPYWYSIWFRPNFASTDTNTRILGIQKGVFSGAWRTLAWNGTFLGGTNASVGSYQEGSGTTFTEPTSQPSFSAGDLLNIAVKWITASSSQWYWNGEPIATSHTGSTTPSVAGTDLWLFDHEGNPGFTMDGYNFDTRVGLGDMPDNFFRHMYEPSTRWDAYWELGRTFYSIPKIPFGYGSHLTRRLRWRRTAHQSKRRRMK